MNYYWFNRQEILQEAKEKLRERYKNLPQEKKDKIKEYQKNISRIGSA